MVFLKKNKKILIYIILVREIFIVIADRYVMIINIEPKKESITDKH
jgi:hypothetical protein